MCLQLDRSGLSMTSGRSFPISAATFQRPRRSPPTAAFTPQARIEIPNPIEVKAPSVSLAISIFFHAISVVLESQIFKPPECF